MALLPLGIRMAVTPRALRSGTAAAPFVNASQQAAAQK
jgi:hypothetical protein